MRLLVSRLILLAVATLATVMLCVFIVTRGDYSSSTSYLAAILDKHERLATLKSPRIIFVGGSGLAFSLDSPEIERAFRLPVVNMGLHADLGLRWMLAEVKPYVGRGDLIVIVPEFEQFENNFNGAGAVLTETLLTLPSGLNYVESLQQVKTMPEALMPKIVSNMFRYVKRSAGRPGPPATTTEPWYQRNAFNEQGDDVAHLRKSNEDLVRHTMAQGHARVFRQSAESMTGFRDEDAAIAALNRFESLATDRGARTFLSYPCFPSLFADHNRTALEGLDSRLRASLRFEIINSLQQAALPADHFFDSRYHLTAPGREQCSERMMAALRSRGIASNVIALQQRQ